MGKHESNEFALLVRVEEESSIETFIDLICDAKEKLFSELEVMWELADDLKDAILEKVNQR